MADVHLSVTLYLRPGGAEIWSIRAVPEGLVRPRPTRGPVGWLARWGGEIHWLETVPDPFVEVGGFAADRQAHTFRARPAASLVTRLPAEAVARSAELVLEVFRIFGQAPLSQAEVQAAVAGQRLSLQTLATVRGRDLEAHPDWPEAARQVREATAPRPGCIPASLVELALAALKALARRFTRQ